MSTLIDIRLGHHVVAVTWEHRGMRLIADGATPTLRLVLANELETDDGYAFELARPLLLAPGDRISFEEGKLVVVRASGERVLPSGGWSTRCRIDSGHRS